MLFGGVLSVAVDCSDGGFESARARWGTRNHSICGIQNKPAGKAGRREGNGRGGCIDVVIKGLVGIHGERQRSID